jgi:hypothetical protein
MSRRMGRLSKQRSVLRLPTAAVAAALLVLVGAPGGGATTLETVQSGTLSMSSDPGDYIGQGLSYAFATPANLFFARSSQAGSTITVTMRPTPDALDYWSLTFAAPAGQQLLPGTYANAQRASSRSFGSPGLEVTGDFRGCGTVTGSFTVLDATYEPSGYVDSFHATFEQHCEGAAPALRGEVQVVNPPPPPAIAAQLTIAGDAQLTRGGSAIVHGTIACNRQPDPGESTIVINLAEPAKNSTIAGSAAIEVSNCPTTAVTWYATVTPTDPKAPFVKGLMTATAVAWLYDPFYGVFVYGNPVSTSAALKEG